MFGKVRSKVAIAVLAGLAVSSIAVSNAQAAKVTVPSAPTFVKVTSKQIKPKLHHVTVTLERPASTGGSPIISMTVQIVGKSCQIRGKATACTVKNVPLAQNARPKIFATATNKKGTSRRVSLSFALSSGSWLAAGFTPQGKRFPIAVTKLQNSRVLAGNSTKWKKFQAISRNAVSSASATKQVVPRTGNPSVVFNITGVVGIALPDNSNQATQSGMFAVRSDGTTIDSLMAGSLSASVRDFYSAPNGRFYVTFTSRTALVQGGTLCALAEVNSLTGVATCVDSTIESVALTILNSDSPPIQFDAQGNVYYTGMSNSKFVLRKSVNGTTTDIINDNITLGAFIVLPDGTVILKGTTQSSMTSWLRRLGQNGALSNIALQGTWVTFVARFPDGNIYFGNQSNGQVSDAIKRFLTSSQMLDSRDWLSGLRYTTSTAFNILPNCSLGQSSKQICYSPSSISKVFTTTDNRVFGLSNFGGTTNDLVSLYPTVELVNTILTKISVVYQVGTKLVLAGTNAAGTNMLTVYDPSIYQETIIVDQSNETEVYSIAYVAQTGKLLFNGLKFSNNSLVVGEVDLP
jgi:hypothetical protein